MLAVMKLENIHGHTLDESPVGRTEVSDCDRRVCHRDFAMMGGDRRMVDDEIVALAAPYPVESGLEFDLPGLRRSWID